MPSPGSTVNNIDAPLPKPPTGITTSHFRATIAAAAASLESLMPGGVVPLKTSNPPSAVTIQVETADGATPAYYTADGMTVASATNGSLQIAVAPGTTRIPFADGFNLVSAAGIIGGGISVFSSGTVHLACFFEWDRANA